MSPTDPKDLKLDISLVTRPLSNGGMNQSPGTDLSDVQSPGVSELEAGAHSNDSLNSAIPEIANLLRNSEVKVSEISDLPALAVLVARATLNLLPGAQMAKSREVAACRITSEFVQKDFVKPNVESITSIELASINSFLTTIITRVVHSPLTKLLLTGSSDGSQDKILQNRQKTNHVPNEAESMDAIQQIRLSRHFKPIHTKALKRTGSVADADLIQLPTPDSKTNTVKKSLLVDSGADQDHLSPPGRKPTGTKQPASASKVGISDVKKNQPIYAGLEHNPYVGLIRHAPNVDEPEITEKVFQMAIKQSWAPIKEAEVASIIPLAARIMQLVTFEASLGRHGKVDEEIVALSVINRFVEEVIPWKTDEDLFRARTLMSTTVPEAISARLSLSTIEAIVSMSEKQVMRRKLEEGIPYMAVMGLNNRIQAEGECADIMSKTRKLDNLILTVDLLYSSMVVLIPEFLMGYNTAVMNSVEPYVFPGHSTLMWSLAVSVFAIGGPFGAIVGGIFANVYGRKNALSFNLAIFFVGGLAMTLAPGMWTLFFSRLVTGFASGFATVLVPVYMGELAPPALRGTFGTLSQIAMVSGLLAASIVSLWTCTETGWRYLFGITPLLCLMSFYSLLGVKESPRWLFSHSTLPETDKRLATGRLLMELRGFRDEQEVAAEVAIFEDAIFRQKTAHRSAHTLGAMTELLADSRLRPLMICTLILQMAQQFCGINAVFYYSTRFLSGTVNDPLVGSVIIAAMNVWATYVAAKIMDRFSRKGLLLASGIGMFFSCIGITISLDKQLGAHILGILGNNLVALVSTALYVIFFEIGLGPIPWLISSEMFDVKYVATAQSIASQMNWLCNFAVGLGFPFMQDYLGGYTFIPFAIVLLLTVVFVHVYVPETSGKTPTQIIEDANRNRVDVHEESYSSFREKDGGSFADLTISKNEKKGLVSGAPSMGSEMSGMTSSSRLVRGYGSFQELRQRRNSRTNLRRKESFQDLFYMNKKEAGSMNFF